MGPDSFPDGCKLLRHFQKHRADRADFEKFLRTSATTQGSTQAENMDRSRATIACPLSRTLGHLAKIISRRSICAGRNGNVLQNFAGWKRTASLCRENFFVHGK